MESSETKRERTTAEIAGEDLRARIEVIREFRHKTRGWVDLTIDRALADNDLEKELGRFGAYELDYFMDEKRRDILLLNGRRDAALAARAAESTHSMVLGLRNALWLVTVLLIGLIVLVAPMALKHWPL